ncbi:MAG: LemA family protein [Bdellovibrionales bacterium]|nr:LemA family protein [Bdellovibrionales bacterium]
MKASTIRWYSFSLSLFLLSLTMMTSGCGYNRIQGLDEDAKASWSEVLNQYQRRADLIPNLVSTVKGYAKHESETLEKVIAARAKATQITVDAKTLTPEAVKAVQAAQGELSQALGRLMVISEQYPQLKANENFRDLQSQLEGTENRIAVARKRYIETVAEYNKLVRFFPTNLTAKFLLHAELKESFTVEEAAKKVPEVKF